VPATSDRSVSHIANHQLPLEQFDLIARGGARPDTMRLLLDAEYSRRLVLLRELLKCAANRPALLGTLPPAEAAWNALVAIHDLSSEALRGVLLHPQVGTWISHALRQIDSASVHGAPDWVEVGQLHAVTLAAAIHAGVPLRTRVPVRRGSVLLPTLGLASFPSVDGYGVADVDCGEGACRLRVDDEQVEVPVPPRTDGTGWWGLRKLRSRSGDRTLVVSLDDIDPYRNLADPVGPGRLDDRTVATWQQLLDAAWTVLNRRHPSTAEAMAAGLTSIAPLPDDPSWTIRSASTGDGFGGMLISTPPDPATLAVTLVHEFQHIKLGALLHLTTLYREDRGERHYAPWRPDPRPLAGLLQGVYAFFGITGFWRTQRGSEVERDQRIADFEFAYARRQTWAGLRSVRGSGYLTELGERFVRRLTSELRPWLAERVRPDLARAAWAAVADHRAGSRIRYRIADRTWIVAAAAAWRNKAEPPPAASAASTGNGSGPLWVHARPTLFRSRLWEWQDVRLSDVPGVTDADGALMSGDAATAVDGYLRRIRAKRDDLDAWTGLGLAYAMAAEPAWRPLLLTPELVYALHLELAGESAPPSPGDLARWLAAGPV